MSKIRSLGVVMDPIQSIHPKKDTTFRLMLKAETLGIEIHVLQISDLSLKDGVAFGKSQRCQVFDDPTQWWSLSEPRFHPLHEFDVILMRKDPPVDMDYIYATYILELAEANGSLVYNRPQSLRDANEKMVATWFPQLMTRTLVSASAREIKEFIQSEETVIFKPLSGMAGQNIFKCQKDDLNINVIIESLTQYETQYCMVQRYLPEIASGDKRIILIDGEPIPYALARIPTSGEFRGNLARGGNGVGVELSKNDRHICSVIGPMLKEKGFLLVGIDVIGDYLTEINVTSPTCVREIEGIFQVDIAKQFFESLEKKLA